VSAGGGEEKHGADYRLAVLGMDAGEWMEKTADEQRSDDEVMAFQLSLLVALLMQFLDMVDDHSAN
jgi:hypothetical protein